MAEQYLWMKICGKSTAEMERQYCEGLLITAEYKGADETSRGQGYLEVNY
jgi:hypothetical protein